MKGIFKKMILSRKHLPKTVSFFLVHTEAEKVWVKRSKIGGCSSGVSSCGFSKLPDFSASSSCFFSLTFSGVTVLRRESKFRCAGWRQARPPCLLFSGSCIKNNIVNCSITRALTYMLMYGDAVAASMFTRVLMYCTWMHNMTPFFTFTKLNYIYSIPPFYVYFK